MVTPLLSVRNLCVQFEGLNGPTRPIGGVTFDLFAGQLLAVVGDSGSGKTTTMLAILGLLPATPSDTVEGRVLLDDVDLLQAPDATLRRLRAVEIGTAFQHAERAFNPIATIGRQIAESVQLSRPGLSKTELRDRSIAALQDVGIADPELRVDQFPHELSTGMCQRAMIAMALAGEPRVLLADEPTGGLDAIGGAHLVDYLDKQRRERGLSSIIFTRDVRAIEKRMDVVVRLPSPEPRARPFVERPAGGAEPEHATQRVAPTHGELQEPRDDGPTSAEEVLRAEGLEIHFPVGRGFPRRSTRSVRALGRIDLTLHAGETVALVGPSPSGRSVLGRGVARRLAPTSGRLIFEGRDISSLSRRRLVRVRRRLEHLDGNPAWSLDLDQTAQESLEKRLEEQRATGTEGFQRIADLLECVGIDPEERDRPIGKLAPIHRQLVGLARALATNPAILVLDEPAASMDARTSLPLLDAIELLQEQLGFALLLITHDRDVVRRLADHVIVMEDGRIVDSGPTRSLFAKSRHPLTRALLGLDDPDNAGRSEFRRGIGGATVDETRRGEALCHPQGQGERIKNR